MLQAQDLYLQTRAELHQMSKAYSQLEKEHQALNAKHQDLILNSTPSAIVQDLQQQVDDLTAEIDRRSKEYGQLKKEKLSLSNQVQDLHTQNTHLTQVTTASCQSLTLSSKVAQGRPLGARVASLWQRYAAWTQPGKA